MVGATVYIEGLPYRVIIMGHKSRSVKRVLALNFKPFVEYCNGGQPSTHSSDCGYISKRQLTDLRSTQITEGIKFHASRIVEVPTGVTK